MRYPLGHYNFSRYQSNEASRNESTIPVYSGHMNRGYRDEEPEEKPLYPMRINKYLALKNYGTRREGDTMVEIGRVFINGKKAVLGDKVNEDDTVEVRGKGPSKKYFYYAYNKPVGIITHSPQGDEEDIKEATRQTPMLQGVFPIGRLDKDSSGLIILTNDGRITDKLLNPDFDHDKEYEVSVEKKLLNHFKTNMESGVDIEGYVTKKCKVTIVNDRTFRITLTEGKKHQIRRMVANLHNTVRDLKRIRILNIHLGDLEEGEHRALEGEELKMFLGKLGIEH